MNLAKSLFIVLVVALLVACGSSSDDGGKTGPSVTAGEDVTVNEEETVSLTGSASGADSFTYAWTSDNANITITQSDTSSADASFVAPETRTSASTITLTLTATPNEGSAVTDTMIVTVNPINELPVAVITVTQDDRFPTNTFPASALLAMQGSDSTDSDPIEASAAIASYLWAQVSGTTITTGEVLDQETVSLTTPSLTTTETLQFSLTVTDSEGGENTQTVDITVLDVTQTPPTVDAGPDLEVTSGETIVLSGSATSPSASAQPYAYLWTNLTNPVISVDDSSDNTTFAVAPEVSSNQTNNLNFTVTDQFGNSAADSLSILIKPQVISPVNDTGVSGLVNATTTITEASSDFPGQDGDYGRDRITANNQMEKAGAGDEAFDFTKLNNLGDPVSESATTWDCVRDNVTGLVWEVKTTTAGLHSLANTYTWYNVTNAQNGGSSGSQSIGSGTCSIANCNTQDFVNAVNAAGLCGFFDWRIPTHNELMSVVHYGQTTTAFIDNDYFPNTSADLSSPTWYWTSGPNVDGSSGSSQSAWAIDFSGGNDNFLTKATLANIRLVRAGR